MDEDLQDSDNDAIPDCVDLDDDNDGLTDVEEEAFGTDPLSADTDGDGISDYDEVIDGTYLERGGGSANACGCKVSSSGALTWISHLLVIAWLFGRRVHVFVARRL